MVWLAWAQFAVAFVVIRKVLPFNIYKELEEDQNIALGIVLASVWKDTGYYALMVLAREGAAAIGDLRYYADVKGDDFATPLAQGQLGAALASYGDQARADAMFRKAAAKLAALAAEVGAPEPQ